MRKKTGKMLQALPFWGEIQASLNAQGTACFFAKCGPNKGWFRYTSGVPKRSLYLRVAHLAPPPPTPTFPSHNLPCRLRFSIYSYLLIVSFCDSTSIRVPALRAETDARFGSLGFVDAVWFLQTYCMICPANEERAASGLDLSVSNRRKQIPPAIKKWKSIADRNCDHQDAALDSDPAFGCELRAAAVALIRRYDP